MKRLSLFLLLFLLLPMWGWGATYYVTDSITNPGTLVKYRSGAWPDADNGTDGSDIDAVCKLADATEVVLSGGTTGVTYTGTQIDSDTYMQSGKAGVTLRAVESTDPNYTSHNGTVTINQNNNTNTFYISHDTWAMKGFNLTITDGGTTGIYATTTNLALTDMTFVNNDPNLTALVNLQATGNVTLTNPTYSGTSDKPFILQAAASNLIVSSGTIDGSSNATTNVIQATAGTSVSIHDLSVTGGDSYSTTASAINIAEVATVDIYDNTINKAGYYSIRVVNPNTHLDIHGNDVSGGHYHGIGVSLTGSGDHNVYHNNVHDMVDNAAHGGGIVVFGGTGAIRAYYNLVKPAYNGVDFQAGDGSQSYNNTVIGGKGHGIDQQLTATNSRFANNTVYKLDATDASECFSFNDAAHYGASYKVYTDNNLCYIDSGTDIKLGKFVDSDGVTHEYTRTQLADWKTAIQADASILNLAGTSNLADANTQFADPLFRSATDYRLRAGSPAINAGTDVGLTTDFLGKPIRGVPDIGAYEFQPVNGGMLMGMGVGF